MKKTLYLTRECQKNDAFRKIWMTMKLSVILFLVSLTQLMATEAYAQFTKLTLQLKDASVKEVLHQIEDESEFFFLYNSKLVDVDRKVSGEFKDQKISEVLNSIFEGADVAYTVVDRQIVLTNKADQKNFTEVINQEQQKTITGTVTDKNGPIPGANVVVTGTTTGAITDSNGKYTLAVPQGAQSLTFTFIGMQSQEIPIGTSTQIDVTMNEMAVGLDDVVVVGYGRQSRQVMTTSISKLDSKVLESIPYANVGQSMTGTLAGVRVQSTSGMPGTSPQVIIRGGTSINNPDGAAPLYIVDGVIRNDMTSINPADVESLQVLKDAAATSIYGARGSNGVVIINTKSGKAGTTRVTYNYDLSLSNNIRFYDLMNARDYLYYQRLGTVATASLPGNAIRLSNLVTASAFGTGNDLTNNTWSSVQYLTPQNQYKLDQGWQSMPDPVDPSKTLLFSDTDWQHLLFRTAISHNHNLNVSGGTEKATFNLGIGYLDGEGVAVYTNYKRYSLNLSSSIKVTDNIQAFWRVAYTNSTSRDVSQGAASGDFNIFKIMMDTPPTMKLYFEDGTFATGFRGMDYTPPEYIFNTMKPNRNLNDLTLVLGATWKIIPGLTFDPQFSFYQTNQYNRFFQMDYWNGPTSLVTSRVANASYTKNFNPQAEGVFTYAKSINNVHNLEVKAGFSYWETNNYYLYAAGDNAATNLIPTLNASGRPTSVTGTESKLAIAGYFTRVTYNYKEKYLFNASLRYDGASNLGSKSRWGAFPGISLGWNIDKENFWSVIPANLLKLKLRTSYGVNGNISGLGPYTAQGTVGSGSQYNNAASLAVTVLPNQNLQWEQSKTLDFGMDFGLFNNRVNILFDTYIRHTDQLLTSLNLPRSTGFASIFTNYGSLENRGNEVELNVNVLPATSDFQWNISLNIADVKTKILKLPDNGQPNNRVGGFYVWDAGTETYMWKGGLQEGGRINDFYGFQSIGVYATNAEAANAPTDMIITTPDKKKYGGDFIWLDTDGNGITDTRDYVYLGNPYPTTTGGFSNTFSYKGIQLYSRMDYTLGGTVYYENYGRYLGCPSGLGNLSNDLLRSWMNDGDVTDIPRYYWADQIAQRNFHSTRQPSGQYPKTDFWCLREVTLSYNLPNKILQKLNIADLRLNVTGNNLYYFTKYPGLNPEATSTDSAFPNPRNIIFGVSIGF